MSSVTFFGAIGMFSISGSSTLRVSYCSSRVSIVGIESIGSSANSGSSRSAAAAAAANASISPTEIVGGTVSAACSRFSRRFSARFRAESSAGCSALRRSRHSSIRIRRFSQATSKWLRNPVSVKLVISRTEQINIADSKIPAPILLIK